MPTTVTFHYPGSTSYSDEFPDEVRWSFSVMVDGQAGIAEGYFARGTTESIAAAALHSALVAHPGDTGGVTSTAGGSSGSSGGTGAIPSVAGSGVIAGAIVDKDDLDDDDIPKMKTADGT